MAGGIVAEGITQTQRNFALQGLLDTASFKFITSLVGLFLSIVYALFWRKVCLRRAERALTGFLSDLDILLPLRTTTAAQEETNELTQRQLTQLETFSNDLAVSIASALDGALDQRLGDHIGPLTRAMEQLAAGMTTQNQDAVGNMLDAFLQSWTAVPATKCRRPQSISRRSETACKACVRDCRTQPRAWRIPQS